MKLAGGLEDGLDLLDLYSYITSMEVAHTIIVNGVNWFLPLWSTD